MYLLKIAHDGFREERRLVNVLLGPPVTANVTLAVGEVKSETTVTGEAGLIHAENGDVSATMDQKQIAEVPNPGNDLTYIAQTVPGAIMQMDYQAGSNFSILGMSGQSFAYTIDGMNNNENGANFWQAGALFLWLGQNQIQEATVVSTGYSGEFGGELALLLASEFRGVVNRPPNSVIGSASAQVSRQRIVDVDISGIEIGRKQDCR